MTLGGHAASLKLAPGEILVVLREREEREAGSLEVLATTDRELAATRAHGGGRHRFVEGRRLIYAVLGAMTGASPEALAPVVQPGGRLVLRQPWGDRFGISLSHGHRHDALAVSGGAAVGVDIEDRPPPDVAAVAETVMTDAEFAAFRECPADRREQAFLRLWTRKEAILKAAGIGFLVDPRRIAVGFATVPVRIEECPDLPGGPWSVCDVDAPVTCALATSGEAARVRLLVLGRDSDRT